MCEVEGTNVVPLGIDLSEFYMSVEWDILEVPAVRNEKFYTCCDEPYLDITFNITMRRKTLFYTVNLIIPCMGISFLTVLTFYLPSDSGEKVSREAIKQKCIEYNSFFSLLGDAFYFDPDQLVCVLPAGRRNYSSNFACGALTRQISHIRYDTRLNKYLRDRGGAQRSFPVASNAQNGPVGQTSLHTHLTQTAYHETASIPAWQTHVSSSCYCCSKRLPFMNNGYEWIRSILYFRLSLSLSGCI